jgi:hypothetical protein
MSSRLGWRAEIEADLVGHPGVYSLRSSPAALTDLEQHIPRSFSLSRFRKFPFDQGQVGTCWVNATVQLMQIHTAAVVTLERREYEITPLSRRFVGYWGKRIDGTNGNPDDGGSIQAALLAMSDDRTSGRGVCHEYLFPYIPDRRVLAQDPTCSAVADATGNRVSGILDLAGGSTSSSGRSSTATPSPWGSTGPLTGTCPGGPSIRSPVPVRMAMPC